MAEITAFTITGNKESPYLNARDEETNRANYHIEREKKWVFIAFFSLSIALVSLIGVIYIGSQSKIKPYIVEVDTLGQQIVIAPVSQADTVDARIIRMQLAEFIVNLRTVTPDQPLQKDMVIKAYSMISTADPSSQFLSNYYKGNEGVNSPFHRALISTVHVDVKSVMPRSKDTWEVEWIETVRSREGKIKRKIEMESLLNIYIKPSESMHSFRANPMGVYVRDVSWSELTIN